MDLMCMECRSVNSILLSSIKSKPTLCTVGSYFPGQVSNMISFFPQTFHFDNTGNNFRLTFQHDGNWFSQAGKTFRTKELYQFFFC